MNQIASPENATILFLDLARKITISISIRNNDLPQTISDVDLGPQTPFAIAGSVVKPQMHAISDPNAKCFLKYDSIYRFVVHGDDAHPDFCCEARRLLKMVVWSGAQDGCGYGAKGYKWSKVSLSK